MMIWSHTEIDFEWSKSYGESESWTQNTQGNVGVVAAHTTTNDD